MSGHLVSQNRRPDLSFGTANGDGYQEGALMGRATRVLCEGIYFGEGPRWREGRLWFSDFFAHTVSSISLAGDRHIEIELDDQPSGLGWMPDGSLLYVSMKKRQVLRRSLDGTARVHADLSPIAASQIAALMHSW